MLRKQNRKGRPPSNKNGDDVIASAAHELTLWGFSQREEVFPAIAKAARDILGRVDHAGFALGPDRIEQIYKQWVTDQVKARSFETWSRTRTIPDINPIFFRRGRYTKDSLARYRPPGTINALAKKLLKGWRPRSTAKSLYVGPELELSTKELAELDGFPHTKAWKNGVEK